MIVTGDNNTSIENVIKIICLEFKCRDLGILKSFLGIEVTRQHDRSLMLIHAKYAMELLARFNMSLCKPCWSPTPTNSKLVNDEDNNILDDPTPFRMLVGFLQ